MERARETAKGLRQRKEQYKSLKAKGEEENHEKE